MSVFKKFLTEKRRRDYGRKGSQGSTSYERMESRSKTQDPSKTTPSKRLGTDKPRVIKAPDGSVTYTNMPEPSGSVTTCLLYTSPSPRDLSTSRMPSSA